MKDTPTAAKPFEELTDEEKMRRLYQLMEQQAIVINDLETRMEFMESHSHQGGKLVISLDRAKKVKDIHPVLNGYFD